MRKRAGGLSVAREPRRREERYARVPQHGTTPLSHGGTALRFEAADLHVSAGGEGLAAQREVVRAERHGDASFEAFLDAKVKPSGDAARSAHGHEAQRRELV